VSIDSVADAHQAGRRLLRRASVNDWTGRDVNEQQLQKVKFESGFIAALDQSGGSTPQALKLYGVPGRRVHG